MRNAWFASQRVSIWFSVLVLAGIGFAQFSVAHAAPVPINVLSVDSITLKVEVTGDGTFNFSGPVVPPANLVMGTYQDPIVSGPNWKIYSTNAFGKPAPSGSVDGALGTIDVDFSSLRGQISGTSFGMLDFELWPLVNPPSGGTYNGSTNKFTLDWSNAFSVDRSGVPFPVTGTASVSLAGTVSPIPIPAALWLFGSGFLGLVAVMRRRRVA